MFYASRITFYASRSPFLDLFGLPFPTPTLLQSSVMSESTAHTNHTAGIENVKRYIQNHTDEALNLEVLAEIACLSIPHFHRVFHAEVGENAASYVRRIRMERAGAKLRMGAVDIAQVAFSAGYGSHAAFSKTFKRHFGLCPGEFRQLNCQAATEYLRKR
jgi:transcriptional regulator GlxA family with amidase domain